MGFSQYPTITDELLSAYIDDAVNAAERAAVEEAAANDSEIAWRLESLQHTVSMLGQLTDVPLPRSFTLNEALVEAALVENHSSSVGRLREAEAPDSLWNRWLDFWRSGSPIWRNAAAACALLLVVVLVGGSVVFRQPISSQQSSELAATRSADARASFEQTAIANAPAVTDVDGEAVSARVAMAPESASARRDLAGPEQTNNGEASRLADETPMELADAATAGMALQEEQSASPEPLAASSVADSENMVADVESAPVSDPAPPDAGGELAAGELAANAPDADQLIVASAMVMRATIPSEGEVTEGDIAEDTVAGDETVEKTAGIAIAEPLPAQPLDDAAEPLEAESMPEAAASASDATEQPGAAQESSDESAPEEAVMQKAENEEAPQDQDPQDGTDSVQPSTVAMADIARDAEPAPEAVVEESSAPDPSGQSSTEETAALPLAGGRETAINSMSPLGMLAIVLAILALAFFAMWLRSRSTTVTRSS